MLPNAGLPITCMTWQVLTSLLLTVPPLSLFFLFCMQAINTAVTMTGTLTGIATATVFASSICCHHHQCRNAVTGEQQVL